MYQNWVEFFSRLFEIQNLKFERCVKPQSAVGDPVLIIFSDGSNLAYGCCAYTQWELSDGTFVSKLLIAKEHIYISNKKITKLLSGCSKPYLKDPTFILDTINDSSQYIYLTTYSSIVDEFLILGKNVFIIEFVFIFLKNC